MMATLTNRIVVAMVSSLLLAAAGLAVPDSEVGGSFERVLKVTGPVEMNVSVDSSDFHVRAGAASEVRILGRIQAHTKWQSREAAKEAVRDAEAHPPIEQQGNMIRIGWRGAGRPSPQVSIDYELVVPADTRWHSEADSGDLFISGIRGPVEVRTGSGDIFLESVKGAVRAHTGSGDASLKESGLERVEIESGSGDVHLQLPPAAGCDLTAQTSSGEISIAPQVATQVKMPHSEIHLKVRGGGVPVNIRTGSGDIRVE